MYAKNIALALAFAAAASAADPAAAGDACRNTCIQNAVNSGNSPNFAECAASSASCAGAASSTTAAPTASSTSPGEACRIKCIQDATNSGNSPNFAVCAASSASCAAAASSTTAAPAPSVTSPGEACRNKCIQNAVNSGNSPNFAECAASSASCAGAAAPTTFATITSAPAPVTTSPGEACRIKCIQDATNSGNSPNFAVCAASSASCAGAAPATKTEDIPAASPLPAANQLQKSADGSEWTLENVIRYCSADGSGCDYNFDVNTNDGVPTKHCTVIRTSGNGPTESWYDLPCNSDDGKDVKISWGYATEPGPPFAVMTVVNNQQKALAYFGISNVNGQPVTASSPSGSGHYGNIGPEPVYLF